MKLLYLIPLLALAGCSYSLYLSDADEHGGRVNLVTDLNHEDAVAKAKDHCHQYNLGSRIVNYDAASSSMTFSCQPAP